MVGLQEDMAGPSQSDLECMKILLPGFYVETLVSACFLCVESDLLGLPLAMNLCLYLAMLLILHAETTSYNSLGRRRSSKTQALPRQRAEPSPMEGGGVPRQRSLVPLPGMEALHLCP